MYRPILIALVASAPGLAIAQGAGIQAGKWEIVTTIRTVNMPGAPPAIANMMKGKPIKVSHCITPEEAARGPQDMMKTSKQCQFTRYSMAGGKLSSEMVCRQNGGTMTSTSTGSFTATSFTASGHTVMTGGQAMTMDATTVGRRVGDCK